MLLLLLLKLILKNRIGEEHQWVLQRVSSEDLLITLGQILEENKESKTKIIVIDNV